MIAMIDAHREVYGVEPICRVLAIAPSTYYEHVARRRNPARLPARARRGELLRSGIPRVWGGNFRGYGGGKVWRQLGRGGMGGGGGTPARPMGGGGFLGGIPGKAGEQT